MAKIIGDTPMYVEPKAHVKMLDNILADVKACPGGDTLNEVQGETLVHTQAGTLDKKTLNNMEVKSVSKSLLDTLSKSRGPDT